MLSTSQLPAHAVLGLEAFADGEAIRRRANTMAMRARLAGDPNGHAEAARQAAERLADPQEWLRDSLRWLVLTPGTLERAGYDVEALCADPVRALQPALRAQSEEVKAHNTAVVGVLNSTSMPSVPAATEAIGLVANAVRALRPRSEDGRVASRRSGETSITLLAAMEDAVARRADPRLGDRVVESARSEYLANMVRPLLEEVRGQLGSATHAHLQPLLSACVAAETECGGVGLRDIVLRPLLERCEVAIGEYSKRIETTKTKEVLASLVSEARGRLDGDMRLVAGCGEIGGSFATRVRDAYAQFLRTCAIRGCNEFKAFGAAEPLLSHARTVAASTALLSQLSDDINQAAEAVSFARCVYCGMNDADGSPAEVPMFRVTGRNFGSVSYQSLKAPVPRCRACSAKQDTRETVFRFFAIGGAVIGLIAGAAMSSGGRRGGGGDICCGLGIGTVVGFIAGSILGTFIQWLMSVSSDRGGPRDFPPITSLLREGWKFGTKPGKYD
jgi:hypothetical protein